MRDPRPQKIDPKIETPDAPLPFAEAEPDAKLDDVMMAMDVVDTLRHERMLVVRDVNAVERRENLVDRLRGIYRGQGIEVPDDILLDGVRALEEERFRYQPPRESFGTRLAMIYINRRRWLPGVWLVLGIVALAGGLSAAWSGTQALEETRIERTLSELPAELDAAYADALAAAGDAGARSAVEAAFGAGEAALRANDVSGAQGALAQLEALETELDLAYNLEVVSRPGERSGVFRDADGGGRAYYLVVEAVTPSGEVATRTVESREDGRSARTDVFAQQVTQDLYERVARDKAQDGVVDAATIATKDRGTLDLDRIDGVLDGAILDW